MENNETKYKTCIEISVNVTNWIKTLKQTSKSWFYFWFYCGCVVVMVGNRLSPQEKIFWFINHLFFFSIYYISFSIAAAQEISQKCQLSTRHSTCLHLHWFQRTLQFCLQNFYCVERKVITLSSSFTFYCRRMDWIDFSWEQNKVFVDISYHYTLQSHCSHGSTEDYS